MRAAIQLAATIFIAVPGVAHADSKYYWQCNKISCSQKVTINFDTYPLPVDVNISCKDDAYGEFRPNSIKVMPPGVGVMCSTAEFTNGVYMYRTCYKGIAPPKHDFKPVLKADCNKN